MTVNCTLPYVKIRIKWKKQMLTWHTCKQEKSDYFYYDLESGQPNMVWTCLAWQTLLSYCCKRSCLQNYLWKCQNQGLCRDREHKNHLWICTKVTQSNNFYVHNCIHIYLRVCNNSYKVWPQLNNNAKNTQCSITFFWHHSDYKIPSEGHQIWVEL